MSTTTPSSSPLELVRGQRSHVLVVLSNPKEGSEEVFRSWYLGLYQQEMRALTPVLSGQQYEPHELDELTLAYACSIHRAQGSEYPCVVVPLVTQHYLLLQRNLLYTAVTRARRLCVLVGDVRALRRAVENDALASRNTGLAERLRGPVVAG